MPQRRLVQLVAQQPPLWQESVHVRREPLVVTPLQQMHHLVDDDVLDSATCTPVRRNDPRRRLTSTNLAITVTHRNHATIAIHASSALSSFCST
jgi:hypothetical protein